MSEPVSEASLQSHLYLPPAPLDPNPSPMQKAATKAERVFFNLSPDQNVAWNPHFLDAPSSMDCDQPPPSSPFPARIMAPQAPLAAIDLTHLNSPPPPQQKKEEEDLPFCGDAADFKVDPLFANFSQEDDPLFSPDFPSRKIEVKSPAPSESGYAPLRHRRYKTPKTHPYHSLEVTAAPAKVSPSPKKNQSANPQKPPPETDANQQLEKIITAVLCTVRTSEVYDFSIYRDDLLSLSSPKRCHCHLIYQICELAPQNIDLASKILGLPSSYLIAVHNQFKLKLGSNNLLQRMVEKSFRFYAGLNYVKTITRNLEQIKPAHP